MCEFSKIKNSKKEYQKLLEKSFRSFFKIKIRKSKTLLENIATVSIFDHMMSWNVFISDR